MSCNCGNKKLEDKQQAILEKFEAKQIKQQLEKPENYPSQAEIDAAFEKHYQWLRENPASPPAKDTL